MQSRTSGSRSDSDPNEAITWNEAVERVGRAKYGSDRIIRLTEREQYLIDQYGDEVVSGRSSILPGKVSWLQLKSRPRSVTVHEEVGRAEDRRRWKTIQDDYVRRWLTKNGFSPPRVNPNCLENKLLAQFGVAQPERRSPASEHLSPVLEKSATQENGTLKPQKSRPRKSKAAPTSDRIAQNIRDAIANGQLRIDNLKTMRDESLAHMVGTKEMPSNGWSTKNGTHPQRSTVVKVASFEIRVGEVH
jgi:hypothetical protein